MRRPWRWMMDGGWRGGVLGGSRYASKRGLVFGRMSLIYELLAWFVLTADATVNDFQRVSWGGSASGGAF